MYKLSVIIAFFMLATGPAPGSDPVKNGIWQATLQRPDGRLIVFNMESKDSSGKKVFYILNGAERMLVDDIKAKSDSLIIQLPFFESQIRARLESTGNLSGFWIKKLADKDQYMPFKALFNEPKRFLASSRPMHNISGRWAVVFRDNNNEASESIGEFSQNGTHLSGTFLNPTGDYRFLEGVVTGDTLKLSAFDGGHAFLFTALIKNDSTINGGFLFSGLESVETWTGKKNPAAKLPDEYSLTRLKPGATKLHFRFKDINGRMVSNNDAAFKNKVVIVQTMGSWCPNCMDETRFLSDYYNQHRREGLEIIALAYERSTDFERSRNSLKSFQQRFQVRYPVLITGVTVSDSLRTEKTLPQLEKIEAFPTSIFIDRKGTVRQIYSGFTGPGTGEHYEQFRIDFDKTVKNLLRE